MKYQVLFSLKSNEKYSLLSSAAIVQLVPEQLNTLMNRGIKYPIKT